MKTEFLKYNDNIYVKMEELNLSGSIKDRISKFLFSYLKPLNYHTIVIASSGNMAISLAMCNNYYQAGYKIIVYAANITTFTNRILEYLNTEIYICQSLEDAISEAQKQGKKEGIYYFDQFNNELSVAAYYDLSIEILKTKINFDYIICGIGTGATLKSLIKIYGHFKPNTKFIGISPVDHIYGLSNTTTTKIKNSLPQTIIKKEYTFHEVKKEFIENFKNYPFGFSTCASLIAARELDKDKKVLIIETDGYFKYV